MIAFHLKPFFCYHALYFLESQFGESKMNVPASEKEVPFAVNFAAHWESELMFEKKCMWVN
jgi:hypothetical protein